MLPVNTPERKYNKIMSRICYYSWFGTCGISSNISSPPPGYGGAPVLSHVMQVCIVSISFWNLAEFSHWQNTVIHCGTARGPMARGPTYTNRSPRMLQNR